MNNKYDQTKLIKTRKERGMKCIVPDTLRNDLRLETKLSSACRDIHKVLIIHFLCTSGERFIKIQTECRTLADYKNKKMDFPTLVDCTRFFPAKTCIGIDEITINFAAEV